ncbi:hypothetical protein AC1031_004722 [Aphanomyces cochlioides]|nr:hypothetical protein AC1031_004722 [Aphanomyces cochlioides]
MQAKEAIMIILTWLHRQRQRRLATALRLRSALKERNFVHAVSLLKQQQQSPWYTLYASRNTPSFLTTVSLTSEGFDELLRVFSVECIVKAKPRPPRIQHKHAVLGMLLHFYTAAVEPKTLQELFAIPPSTFSRIINKAEHALSRALDKLPQSAVKWPSKATQRYWASKSNAREPLVTGVFAFADVKNLRVQQPSHTELQTAQYNGTNAIIPSLWRLGWLHCVFVTGVLCFRLDGTLMVQAQLSWLMERW